MQTVYIVIMVVGTVLVSYIVTSVLLLRFPGLLHRRKKTKFRAFHISHRGGAGENIENTMTAFKHAVNVGTDMLELDCHLTRDGKVIVSHDGSLKRTCGVEGNVHDYDYKDLPLLKEKHKLDFQPAFVYDGTGSTDRTFPLLRDVFKAFPETPINIDIKIDDDELMEKVNGLVLEFNRQDITAWGNRSSTVINKLYRMNPDVPVFFSIQRTLALTALFYTGLLPFVPLKESMLEIIMPSIFFDTKKFTEEQQQQTLNRKFRFLLKVIDKLLMSPVLFRHLERRGIQTYLWVLNEENEFERAFELGATGVMTDFPLKLKDFLDKHPQYKRADISSS